jgi:hypothetical protein
MLDLVYQKNYEHRLSIVILVVFAFFLVLTNKYIVVFEDEATIVGCAGNNSALETLGFFINGKGQHEHPPLFDIFLHFWLRITGGSFALIRLPSVIFYCCSLWFVADTARILWNKRLVAILIGIAWPVGYFLGRPAHWSSLAMLCIAGSTWSYFHWRNTEKLLSLVLFSIFSIALVYTNYLGWAFLAALGIDFILDSPKGHQLRKAIIVALIIVVSFLPLVIPLLHEVQHGANIYRPILFIIANAAYYGYSLLVSEAVAPWHWPAIIAIIGIAGLVYSALSSPRTYRFIGLLFLVYVSSSYLGIVGGKRLGMFGPWLILCLTGLTAATASSEVTGHHHRMMPHPVAVISLFLVFTIGWIGVITQRWYASYRYIEPWPQVVSQVIKASQAGDRIITIHPSFYFYAHYEMAWPKWYNLCSVDNPIVISGRAFVPLTRWQEAAGQQKRVIYVRSVVMPYLMEADRQLMNYLTSHYHLVNELRLMKDEQVELKRRLFPNQPLWRIEVLTFEQ